MTASNGHPVAPPPAKPLNAMLSNIPTTIFAVMSALAVEHGSVNLGQGRCAWV